MALKATIVALALSSVDSFAPAATGAPRRPAFAIIIRQRPMPNPAAVYDARAQVSRNIDRASRDDVDARRCNNKLQRERFFPHGMFSDPMTADDFVAKL